MESRSVDLIAVSSDKKKKVFIDSQNKVEIMNAISEEVGLQKKFYYIVNLLLNNPTGPASELYGFENIEKGCEHVTAMKPFPKSNRNARIYCQHWKSDGGYSVIIVAEFLHKKKNQQVKKAEKNIIRRMASYKYDLSGL